MTHFRLVSVFATLAFALGIASNASAQPAFCAGQGNNTRVSVQILFTNNIATNFKLAVAVSGQSPVSYSGVVQEGGGDGMIMATLKTANGEIAGMDWWVVPTITPRITLRGQSQPIMLNCQNLWPQQQ